MEKEVLAILVIFSVIALGLFFMIIPTEKISIKETTENDVVSWGQQHDIQCGSHLAEEYHEIDSMFFTMPLVDPKSRDKTPQERAQVICKARTSKVIVERLKQNALEKLTIKECPCPPEDNPKCSIPEGPRLETNFDCKVREAIHPKTKKVTHYEVYRRGNAFAYCTCKEIELTQKIIELPEQSLR